MRLISPASENLHIRGGSTESKPRLLDIGMLQYFCVEIFSERRRVARRRVFDSNRARALFVENPKTLLRIDRHVENENWTSHKRGPRLFREGLKSCKVPELTLLHRNLGNLVIEHPIAKHGQPALFGVGEHGLWQRFPHRLVSLNADFADVLLPGTTSKRDSAEIDPRSGSIAGSAVAELAVIGP